MTYLLTAAGSGEIESNRDLTPVVNAEKARVRNNSYSYKRSGALERRLYVRSSQIPDYPNAKQCVHPSADHGNRAVAYSNFLWNEEQLRSVHYDG